MIKIQQKRLLNVARALREGKPEDFCMDTYVHSCGTPACALGHYASRRDLQRLLVNKIIDSFWGLDYEMIYADGVSRESGYITPCASHGHKDIHDHFGITAKEADELFDESGCGGAKTNIAAAKYIERFVARKVKEKARASNR